VKPVFPFGFGLSYTTFAYSDLSVASTVDAQTGTAVLTVTYAITNTGRRQGAEASQVYLTLPAEATQPSKRLVGFQKVDLMPGSSQQVTLTIDSSASNHPLSYWVPENDAPVTGWGNGSWSTPSGDYTVHVGTSSADTPLEQTINVSLSPTQETPPASTPPPTPSPPATSPPPATSTASGGGGGTLDIFDLLVLMSLVAAAVSRSRRAAVPVSGMKTMRALRYALWPRDVDAADCNRGGRP
jgi:hypothetical protein